jgi:hypothetical protein
MAAGLGIGVGVWFVAVGGFVVELVRAVAVAVAMSSSSAL